MKLIHFVLCITVLAHSCCAVDSQQNRNNTQGTLEKKNMVKKSLQGILSAFFGLASMYLAYQEHEKRMDTYPTYAGGTICKNYDQLNAALNLSYKEFLGFCIIPFCLWKYSYDCFYQLFYPNVEHLNDRVEELS